MLRKRLIFGLIYNNGAFMQSRNFRLQRVGDSNWLEKNYQFQKISFSLDELMVVDATRSTKNISQFAMVVRRLVNNVFIPVSAGGGIRTIEDATVLFENGADKVIVNSALHYNPTLATEIVNTYGTQSLVASIDFKCEDNGVAVYVDDGTTRLSIPLDEHINNLQQLGVGEILLNSITKDGTGFGYDIDVIEQVGQGLSTPLIIMGGAGNEKHLEVGLEYDFVSAVATANLFNFIGNGLPKAREYLLKNEANLANWEN